MRQAAANASGAVSALAAMPYTTTELEKLSGYINSAGDWALYLSREGAEGRLPDEETMEQLREISESVSDLAAQASQLGTQFSEARLSSTATAPARRWGGEHRRLRAAPHRLRARRVPRTRV